jgi:hypothetical protein
MGSFRKPTQKDLKSPARQVSYIWRLLLPVILLVSMLPAAITASASPNSATSGPPREITVKNSRTTSHWKLIRWSDGATVCDMFLEHDQWPTQDDVTTYCGKKVWEEWKSTPVCRNATLGRDPSNCQGLFLRFIDRATHEYTEIVKLPGIEVSINTPVCTPGSWCGARPVIEITAVEPLAGFNIEHIHLFANQRDIIFDGNIGRYTLPETDQQGEWLEYWVDSSYGDNTYRTRIKFRSVVSDDGNAWHFDLIGDQWERLLPPGSMTWSLFPELDDPIPLVLQQPIAVDELNTGNIYLYLTGYLIQAGYVDAWSCVDGGLTTGGAASPCGETAGHEQTIEWQNKYDDQILAAAQKYHVPARLIKSIIASESQFWPESYSSYERGLGNITDNGADLLLKWNTPYYLQLCQPAYGEAACGYGFDYLTNTQQDILRRVILDKVGTPDEIDVLAAILMASANQTGQIVRNQSGKEIANQVSYVDMWKITTANYYAGSGCIGDAITDLIESGDVLTWDNITWNLTSGCSRAESYVRQSFDE